MAENEAVIVKRQVVVPLLREEPVGFACFYADLVTDERSAIHIDLPLRDWDEMGRPENVTLTIEPGDRLT